ncbi:MAG: (Fe-S)-binding protein [Acidobacteriota bacterium]
MRVSLFITCLADQFFANAGADAVRLLRSLNVDVDFPPDQTCCGQPAFNAGYWDEARSMARHTLEVFKGAQYIVLPSGSCAAMIRTFYARLFESGSAARRQAEVMAARTFELAEFVVKVLDVDELGRGLEGKTVIYHHGCHALRELNIREEPVRLLRNSGAKLADWEAAEECCGFGGVFSVKLPEVSAAMADRKLDTLPPADFLTSADGGCLLHLSGRMKNRGFELPVRPLASVLWEARREG